MIVAARQAAKRFEVMGTTAHLVVCGADEGLLEGAANRLRSLEHRWSRFLENSEVSQLNRAMGKAIAVSKETLRLFSVAVEAWYRTGGSFDPSVHDALVGLGYDRTFSEIQPGSAARTPLASPGCDGIEIDTRRSLVRVPVGVRFDPGGIGKGLAADIVAEEVFELGVDGVLVNVGGDLRTIGQGPDDGWWTVEINDPGVATTRLVLGDAAVASSTTSKRRWIVGSEETHHLIDPATGGSMRSRWALVTAIAGEAWWAEAATKALMLNGPAALLPEIAARLVDRNGLVLKSGEFERFER